MSIRNIFIILLLQNIILSVKYEYQNFGFSDAEFNNFHQKMFEDFENQKKQMGNFNNFPKKNFNDFPQQAFDDFDFEKPQKKADFEQRRIKVNNLDDMNKLMNQDMFNEIISPKKLRTIESNFLWKIYSSGSKDARNIPFMKKPQNFEKETKVVNQPQHLESKVYPNIDLIEKEVESQKYSNLNKNDSTERQIAVQTFNEINRFRIKNGLKNYIWSEEIFTKTIEHTNYMVKRNRLSHDNFSQRLKKFGASVENVAMFMGGNYSVFDAAKKFEDQWEHSSGHRANMLARNVSQAAVGVRFLSNSRTYYATMIAVA